MSGFLLDTHILLWLLMERDRVSASMRETLAEQSNTLFASVVTAWELEVKRAIGKLSIPDDLPSLLQENNVQPLSVEFEHVDALRELPLHHRDPFDRMLLAQALAEGLTLVTNDRMLKRYNVPILIV